MKDIIAKLLKEWGVKLVLREMISILKNSDDANLKKLSVDLQTALSNYEDRDSKKVKIG